MPAVPSMACHAHCVPGRIYLGSSISVQGCDRVLILFCRATHGRTGHGIGHAQVLHRQWFTKHARCPIDSLTHQLVILDAMERCTAACSRSTSQPPANACLAPLLPTTACLAAPCTRREQSALLAAAAAAAAMASAASRACCAASGVSN